MLAKAWKDPKIIGLAASLRMPIPHVMGHLMALLLACGDHIDPSGRFDEATYRCLEGWAMWEGKKGRLARNLLKTGFIVKHENGYTFQEFSDWVPDFVRNRWAMRKLREPAKSEPGQDVTNCSPTVTHMLPPHSTTQHSTAKQGTAEHPPAQHSSAQQAVAAQSAPQHSTAPALPPAFALANPAYAQTKPGEDGTKKRDEDAAAHLLSEVKRLRTRMEPLLDSPDATPEFLLLQLGVRVDVAKSLAAENSEDRIRQVIRYALTNSEINPAGLAVRCLRNKAWSGA